MAQYDSRQKKCSWGKGSAGCAYGSDSGKTAAQVSLDIEQESVSSSQAKDDIVLAWLLQVQTQLANHVAAVGPAVLVGLACGVLGTAFTVLNVKIIRLRDSIIQVTGSAHFTPAIKICIDCSLTVTAKECPVRWG